MPDTAEDVLAPNAPPQGIPDSNVPPSLMPNATPPIAGNQPPIATESGDPLSSMIQPQTTPAYQDPEMVAGSHHQSWLAHVMDKVGGILGGDTTLHVTKKPDGSVEVTHDPSSEGEKWGRVAAAALGGAAHGIAVGQGPGGPARAAAAGIETGLQQPQQRLDEANKEASVEQQRMQAHANLVHTQQQTVAQTFANKMNNVAATQAQIDQANSEEERFKNAPGAEDMGTFADMDAVSKSPNAALILQHHPGGTMRTVPIFDGDHNITGVRAYVVDKGWGDLRNDKPVTYLRAKASETAGGDPTFEKITIPAGAHTNAEIDTILNAQNTANLKTNADVAKAKLDKQKESSEMEEAKARIPLIRAQTAEANARANQIRTQAKQEEGTPQQNAEMMVDGLAAPSQFSKRAKEYNQLLPLANAYSMQKYGKPFDAEISESRYHARQAVIKDFADGKQADQIQSFNQFLGHAANLSNSIGQLRQTNSPLLNTAYNTLRTKLAGRPEVAAILPQIEAVRTEYQNFLNNNHALHGADIKEGYKMLDENASLAQMEAAIKSFSHTALIRTAALNDRYKRTMGTDVPDLLNDDSQGALKTYGLDGEAQRLLYSSQPGQQPPQQPKPNAPVVPAGGIPGRDTKGNIVGYSLNGKWTGF